MIITDHAMSRMNQRAISKDDISLICTYGLSHKRRGSQVTICNRRAVKQMIFSGVSPQTAERLRGCYVVHNESCVVTVAHHAKRIKLN